MAVLDKNGLIYLWGKIKNTFVAQETGKGLSTNDYTTDEKNKLSGIAAEATKNTVENVLTSTSTTNALSAAQGKALKALIDAVPTGDMSKSVYDTDGDGVVDKAKTADTAGDADTVNGLTVETAVPANAKFTDTTYGVFTSTADGLVPKTDGALDSKFLAADGKWKTAYNHPSMAGNKHIPSGGSSGKILKYGGSSGTAVWGDPTEYDVFGEATSSAAGTDGLVPAPSAGQTKQAYFLGADCDWHQLHGTTSRDASKVYVEVYAGGTHSIMEDRIIPAADAEYAGVMTPAMFTKLNDIATGANKTTVDAAMSSTSTNPVQNKVLYAELANYAKKTDLTNLYKYKGSVASADALPTTGQVVGDVYDIQSASVYGGAGMNVVWDGSKWDPLGEIFSVDSITNAEIDTICV